jgi:RNA polymerase-binding protein DksA
MRLGRMQDRVKTQVFLKAQLIEQQQLLKDHLTQLPILEGRSLGYGNHMADDATTAFEQAKDLALRQNLERILRQVEHALHQFEKGRYGICEECGQEIDPARLEVLPCATLCLKCKERRARA